MAKQYLIIDGYNLLFQTRMVAHLTGPGNLQRARRALLGSLSLFLPRETQENTTIVFDARQALDVEAPEANTIIQVTFAVDFDNADAMIAAILAHHPAPRQVLVVSSDHQVQTAARRRRAQVIDAGEWWDTIQSNPQTELNAAGLPHAPRQPEDSITDLNDKSTPGMTEEERQHWIDVFGEK